MSTADFPGWYVEFQTAVLKQLPRPRDIDQTTAEGWTSNQDGLKKNLANCLLPQTSVAPVEPTKLELLLDFVGIVTTSATSGQFVAKTKFVVNTKRNAQVSISYLGDNFKAWFLNGNGKTEDPISEQTLHYYKLQQSSADGPIIAELGGEEKSETTLFEMFSLMEKQGKGEDGVLLNNGWANIFYIKDIAGVLRAVYVRWDEDGWHVNAYSVENPDRWYDGHQVFSRLPAGEAGNSVLESSEPVSAAS